MDGEMDITPTHIHLYMYICIQFRSIHLCLYNYCIGLNKIAYRLQKKKIK